MVGMDGDWLEKSIATYLTGSKVLWQVYLGQCFEAELWADYNLVDNLRIGAACITKKYELTLEQDGATWTINLYLVTQVNDATGTSKTIRRIMVVSERGTMDEFHALAA